MPEYETGLEAVARSDRLLDALAAGARMSPADPVASMLGGWRDDVRRAPDTHVISLAEAAAALAEGKQAHPHQRFGMTVIGAVAAALLCLGGFGALIYGAGPGDPLYGLHSALFGSSPTTRGDQVALAAQTELDQVQQLVQQGQWQQAQDKLAAVSTTVQDVNDVQRKQQLINQWNNLTVKVVQRDPGATLTPGAPPPILPGMTTPLVPPPAVVPGSTGPSASSSTTPASPTTASSSPATTTSSPTTPSSGSETTTATSGTGDTSSPQTTPTSSAAAPPPPPSPATSTTTATTTPPTVTTTTAAPPPPASPTPTSTTTAVTSVPSSEDTSTAAAPTSSQQAPAVIQQQTAQQQTAQQQSSESVPVSTATTAHGAEHGSAPGPVAPATTPERRGGN